MISLLQFKYGQRNGNGNDLLDNQSATEIPRTTKKFQKDLFTRKEKPKSHFLLGQSYVSTKSTIVFENTTSNK